MKKEQKLPEAEKVIVLDAVFDPEKNVMVWGVELTSGDRYPIIFKKSEIKTAFKLRKVPVDKEIVEFCERMIGKTINLIIIRDANGKPVPPT